MVTAVPASIVSDPTRQAADSRTKSKTGASAGRKPSGAEAKLQSVYREETLQQATRTRTRTRGGLQAKSADSEAERYD